MAMITGSEALMHAAAASGVTICFANPVGVLKKIFQQKPSLQDRGTMLTLHTHTQGTTEMWQVSALDACPTVRAILGMHETVCTGMPSTLP